MIALANILLMLLLLSSILLISSASSHYPVCSATIVDEMGFIDISKMLTNCTNNIPSSNEPPRFHLILFVEWVPFMIWPSSNCSYFTTTPGGNVYAPTNVSVQLALDNLVNVDDEGSAFTLDAYLRINWTDFRFNLPDIFSPQYLNPECSKEGSCCCSFTVFWKRNF